VSFSIALLLLCSTAIATTYDYYVFAIEWAGSLCATQDCSSSDDAGISTTNMNIHGLWPSVSSGTQPADCPGPAWNPASINSSTTAAMVADWSGLYSSASQFHDHEWTTHGACWNDPNTSGNKINDFFSQVISVAKTLDVYNALISNNIKPSSSATYSTTQLTTAMTKAFNVDKFTIICIEDSDFLGYSKTYFNGFYMCLDLTYKPMDCPSSADFYLEEFGESGCSYDSQLLFPPISTSSENMYYV